MVNLYYWLYVWNMEYEMHHILMKYDVSKGLIRKWKDVVSITWNLEQEVAKLYACNNHII